MSRALLIVALVLAASGCKSIYYNPRFPVLERPERPKLVSIPGDEMKKMSLQSRKDVADNFNKLIDHSSKLEAAVDRYNEHARKQNEILDGDRK